MTNLLEETVYLLRSPANARHLLESIAELEAGKGVVRELIDKTQPVRLLVETNR